MKRMLLRIALLAIASTNATGCRSGKHVPGRPTYSDLAPAVTSSSSGYAAGAVAAEGRNSSPAFRASAPAGGSCH